MFKMTKAQLASLKWAFNKFEITRIDCATGDFQNCIDFTDSVGDTYTISPSGKVIDK